MSLSVNNLPQVKVDAPSVDRSSVSPSRSDTSPPPQAHGTHISNTPARTDNVRPSPNEVMIPGAALNKLFDMLELVLKTMRDMVSGRDLTPAVLVDPGKFSLRSDVREKPVQQDSGKLPVKLDAREQGVKAETNTLPVKPDAREKSVMPDAGHLPVRPQWTDRPAVTPDEDVVPLFPPMPEPDVTVNNNSKADVHLSVNVGHCHCDDKGGLPDRRRRANDVPRPDAEHRPGRRTDAAPDGKPGITPGPTPAPGVVPGVIPAPIPAPGVEPAVTPKPDPETLSIPKSEVTPQPILPDAPDLTPLPDMPVPDLTSPRPNDNQVDARRWWFNVQ
jgi:hypothetical protein